MEYQNHNNIKRNYIMTIGTKIGEYTITGFIDRGGMGTVFQAEKEGVNYALKICNNEDDESTQRFKREVRIMKGIDSPRIIEVIDDNLNDNPPYFVMPLGDRSLEQAVEEGISEEKQFDYVEQFCEGIQLLHEKGIIHRDIKPSNALLFGESIKVSDLGLGKFIERNSKTLTPSGDKTIGSFGYFPPEIYKDGQGKNADVRSDIYCIGKLIYFVFSGGEDPQYVEETSVKADIYTIINKCIKIVPNDRYQNVTEIINALQLCQKMRKSTFSLEEIVSRHRMGVNDQKFADEVYQYLLTLEDDFELLIKSFKTIKTELFQVILRYKQEDVGALIHILSTIYKNGSYYSIDFDDIDILANRIFLLTKTTKSLKDKQDLLNFAINISIEFNRWNAMDTVVKMLNSLSNDEVKSIIPFCIENKDFLQIIRDSSKIPLNEVIRNVIR